jgi:hypothetical protein
MVFANLHGANIPGMINFKPSWGCQLAGKIPENQR